MPVSRTNQDNVHAEVFLLGSQLNHIDWIEGEEILQITSDHPFLVMPRLIAPVLLALLCLATAVYISLGGQFFQFGPAPATFLDTANMVLAFFLMILVPIWFIMPSANNEKGSKRGLGLKQVVLGIACLVVGLMVYRMMGGQIFFFNPDTVVSFGSVFNLVNGILVVTALLAAASAVLIYIESENDYLILTNKRVLLSDRQILGAFKVDQISIEDIQDVSVISKTYLQHWFRYGDLMVQGIRKKLEFHGGEEANEMQAKIMKEVNASRNRQSDVDYRSMVEKHVYDSKPYTPPPARSFQSSRSPVWLRWLMVDNPEVSEKGEIVWRPHWFFLLVVMLRPVSFGVLSVAGMSAALFFEVLPGVWAFAAGLALLLVFLGWSAYEVEDFQNDKYILTPTNIVDIEQKPWGPTDRRSASLGAIQNVRADTTLLSRMIGYGDVFVDTAGGSGQFTFHNIPNPKSVVGTINNYQDTFRRGEEERTLKKMLTLLKYYHTAQVDHGELGNPNGSNGDNGETDTPPPAQTPAQPPAGAPAQTPEGVAS